MSSTKQARDLVANGRGYLNSAWLSAALGYEYAVSVIAGDVSPRNGVTVQFRKATDASGTNATNHGDPVTADDALFASMELAGLGEFSAGVPYTHVSAVVTDQDSPNTYSAQAFVFRPRESV